MCITCGRTCAGQPSQWQVATVHDDNPIIRPITKTQTAPHFLPVSVSLARFASCAWSVIGVERKFLTLWGMKSWGEEPRLGGITCSELMSHTHVTTVLPCSCLMKSSRLRNSWRADRLVRKDGSEDGSVLLFFFFSFLFLSPSRFFLGNPALAHDPLQFF